MIKLSIILPVYNAEKTIGRTILSILNQNYYNYELIIVNDGSKDKSIEIINSLATNFNNIKIISIENSGVSIARNVGLENCLGEYITFIDSDDYYESNAFQVFDNYLYSNFDLIIFDFNKFYENRITRKNKANIEFCIYENNNFKTDALNFIINEKINPNWNKIYRNDIIKSNLLKFDNSINLAEDLVFNLDYIKYAYKVITIDMKLINYFVYNNLGLTSRFRDNKLTIRLLVRNKISTLFSDWKVKTAEISYLLDQILIKDIFGYFIDFYKYDCLFSNHEIRSKILTILNENKIDIKEVNFKKLNYKIKILYIILLSNNSLLISIFAKILAIYQKKVVIKFS